MTYLVSHVHIKTSDPRKTADWYVQAFNFRIVSDEVRIFGEPYTVRAGIEQIRAFSAHADRDDLVGWLRTMPGRPRRVFVVHGEHHVSLAFRERLTALTGWDVVIPACGETVKRSS